MAIGCFDVSLKICLQKIYFKLLDLAIADFWKLDHKIHTSQNFR